MGAVFDSMPNIESINRALWQFPETGVS